MKQRETETEPEKLIREKYLDGIRLMDRWDRRMDGCG